MSCTTHNTHHTTHNTHPYHTTHTHTTHCFNVQFHILQIFRYYVNDGLYGSFNCIVYDHATPQPELVVPKQEDVYRCSIWGPTCDGLDMITEDRFLPEVNVGDWLYFEDMGAYTVAASSTFNGFQKPRSFYYTSTAEM